MTNHHTGYNLKPDGQEDFTIIQYNVDDQYTPHCDGQCDNAVYNPGGRVATAVLYCKVWIIIYYLKLIIEVLFKYFNWSIII